LDTYEVRTGNRAGSGLFFILITLMTNLNLSKNCIGGKDLSEIEILELLPSGGFFVCELPTLSLLRITSDSTGNYYLMDKESTGRMVIPHGNTS
jgi:hypothetical protein